MNGPLVIGFAHLSDRAMERLTPSTVGWLSVEHPFAFDHEPALAEDGRRFESGTENAAGIAGLAATISIVLELGRDTVERIVLERAAELEAAIIARGLHSPRSRHPAEHSGIVFATTGDRDTDAKSHQRLLDHGVRCSLRAPGVRFSPHYFNTPDDLRRAVDLLPTS